MSLGLLWSKASTDIAELHSVQNDTSDIWRCSLAKCRSATWNQISGNIKNHVSADNSYSFDGLMV